MKLNFHSCALLLLILLLISFSITSGRLIASKQEQDEVKLKEITSGVSIVEKEDGNLFNKLMGMEECDKGDEECFKRRMVSEVHLDYIYTQHHKP